MEINEMPISNVVWLSADKLTANSYNPNVVYNTELKLLALSILKQGWIQPVLVTQDYEIIDGYHRAYLAKNNKEVRQLTDGKVPCCVLNLDEPQRMLLTVRINRAKGSHIAVKMSELVKDVVCKYNYSKEQVCKEIGATMDEVNLLLQENVFTKFGFDTNSKFSKAWTVSK